MDVDAGVNWLIIGLGVNSPCWADLLGQGRLG
jgi:hypothetical protein